MVNRFSAMTTDLSASSFHLKAVDEAGYPNMDFEEWYQKGMACFRVRLPRELVLQAFRHIAKEWERRNKIVAMWHIRAFVYGLSGRDDRGQSERLVPEDFSWPIRPDSSWQWIVCAYPDGMCDVDMVHSVSRRFWSEDNGFIDLPRFDCSWFKNMGFTIMRMSPTIKVCEGETVSHLSLVK